MATPAVTPQLLALVVAAVGVALVVVGVLVELGAGVALIVTGLALLAGGLLVDVEQLGGTTT